MLPTVPERVRVSSTFNGTAVDEVVLYVYKPAVLYMVPRTSRVLIGLVVPIPTLPPEWTNKASVLPALILRGERVEEAPV